MPHPWSAFDNHRDCLAGNVRRMGENVMQDSTFDEEVFFSYASEDLEQVRQLARRLWDDYRISSFVADDALRDLARGSDKWEQALIEKVIRCRFFALYNSRTTSLSQWVNREVQRFYDGA